MLRVFRNTAAVATLFICANSASIADSNWTITVNNTSKVAVDVSIYCEKKVVGKATAVPSGKSSKISIPATPPAYQDKYSWKTEITGKLCDMHDVRINSSRTVDVACLPAPSAIERDASTGSATKKVEKPKTEETSKATGSGSSGKKWTIYFKNATKGSEAFDLEIDYQDINDSKALAYTTVNLTAGASKTVQFIPKDGQVRFGLMVSVKGAGTCLIQKLPVDLRADGAGLAFHVERDIPKNIRADAFSCYFDKN